MRSHDFFQINEGRGISSTIITSTPPEIWKVVFCFTLICSEYTPICTGCITAKHLRARAPAAPRLSFLFVSHLKTLMEGFLSFSDSNYLSPQRIHTHTPGSNVVCLTCDTQALQQRGEPPPSKKMALVQTFARPDTHH